jgi:hypothetical protein
MFIWLSEKDKYEITSYAFSYFMTTNLGINASVVKAITKVRPDKFAKDGSLKVSRSILIELQMRVRTML